jgi:hypothetical protein
MTKTAVHSARLPVDDVLDNLAARLETGRNAVLVAPPGAGPCGF